jgi:hypothetical protein
MSATWVVMEGDLFGDDVNLAARLEGLAEPGGICVTRAVRDQVRDRLPFGFADLGLRHVKNIARPVRVFRLEFDPFGEATEPVAVPAEPEVEAQEAARDSRRSSSRSGSPSSPAGRAAEYAAYLERYPEGAFAALARARLAAPLAPAPADPAIELAFWDSVKASDERAMIEAYLAKYPQGEFRALAELRLLALSGRVSAPLASFRHRPLTRAA